MPPTREAAQGLLLRALDAGIDFFDTAALYGFGANESLVGEVLAPHRHRFVLASKCGMQGVNGKRVIDGRPATLKATCEDALRRLRTEVIDLYYLHRWDKQVPIEDSVGAMAELVREGKIRAIGLSEVGSARCAARTPCTPLPRCSPSTRCGAAMSSAARWRPVPSWASLSWPSARWAAAS